MQNPMTISARAEGFPLQLSRQHFFIIHQMYPWLREKGLTDEATDEALALFPDWPIPEKDLELAVSDGYSTSMRYGSGFYRSKTIRVRAEHLQGVIKLLKISAAFQTSGQLGGTLCRRAERLGSISAIDCLADASR